MSTLGAGVRYVENHRAEQGQISSIVAAVDAVDHPGVHGLLVVPVDQPLIAAATVSALLSGFAPARTAVVRATHQGRHGHPVIFASALFGELRHADPSQGARVVVRAHATDALDVDVADPNVLIDIDDPDAYQRVFGVAVPTLN